MMPQPTPNVLKGYVKTESMLLIVLGALAIGFLGGVVFSVYRSSSQLQAQAPDGGAQPEAAMPLPPQQQERLRALLEETRSNPNDAASWAELGHLYFDSGQAKLSIEAYEKSLSLNPEQADVLTDLGVMYRRDGNPRKAVEVFDRALRMNSRHEIALFNKGVVLMHDLQDSQSALETWRKLEEINPQFQTPGGQRITDLVKGLAGSQPAKS